jgi:hypothetical protein
MRAARKIARHLSAAALDEAMMDRLAHAEGTEPAFIVIR